jgi:iron complex outermembrane recepter protein
MRVISRGGIIMLLARHKYVLSASTCLAAAIFVSPSAPAIAQDRQTAQSSGIEEIVVNARRVEESLQRVPITITAVSADALQRQSINNISDFSNRIPAFSLCCVRGQIQSGKLRGVPGVIGYWAEAPVPLGGASLYFDLENVQVLKGPQGTLFGLSTNGGAILFQPVKPRDEFGGYVQGTFGTYDKVGLEGVINVPIVDDKVLFRAGVNISKRKGYIYDVGAGIDRGNENYWNVRAGLTTRFSDNFENTLLFNYFDSRNRSQPFILGDINPVGLSAAIFGQSILGALATQRALGPYKIAGTSEQALNESQVTYHLVNTTTFDFNDRFSLKNIASYVSDRYNSRNDSDGSPVPLFGSSSIVNEPNGAAPQFSEEVQLRGKFIENKLNVTLGGFLAGQNNNPRDINYSVAFGGTSGSKTKSQSLTRAIFGQASYDLSDFIDGLKITGGYRYTWDIRWSSTVQYTAAGVPTTSSSNKGHFKAPSYTVGLEYQYSPDTMFYLSNSKGYSSGGFNPNTPAIVSSYAPENLNNLELGMKSSWSIGGMEARTNLGGYYGWYNNIQVSSATAVPTGAGGTTIVVVTRNAAKGYVTGLEADLTILPVEDLEVSVNGGYAYGKYTRYTSLDGAGNVIDRSNTPFNLTPHWKFNVSATYHLPIDGRYGDPSVTVDFLHHGKNFNDSTPPIVPQTTFPSYQNVNLTLDWRNVWGFEGVDAQIAGTNLTNNTVAQFGFFAYKFEVAPGLPIGFLGVGPALPQMWSFRLKYTY